MGKGKYGLKIRIPEIYECHESRDMEIKVNGETLKGRPTVVLRKFLELGFNRGWFKPNLVKFLIAWGFSRRYWTDWDLFVEDIKHFLFDNYGKGVLKETEEK